MKVQIKKFCETAIIPTYGSRHAAGMDLYACLGEPVVINPKATAMVGTGLAIAVPIGYAGFIYARSGLATKQGLRPANCVGVCDADYTGEYIVALHNDSNEYREVKHGDRIAQLVIAPVSSAEFEVVNELLETERGAGGFGSTGE